MNRVDIVKALNDRLINAITNRKSVAVVETLVVFNPQTLLLKNETSGQTPLHHALRLRPAPSFELIELLVKRGPEAVKIKGDFNKDSKGSILKQQTPLHVACQLNYPLEVIQLMVLACPSAAECLDSNGETPLHVACNQRLPLPVIQLLIEECPSCIKIISAQGSTALHSSCKFNAPPRSQPILGADLARGVLAYQSRRLWKITLVHCTATRTRNE